MANHNSDGKKPAPSLAPPDTLNNVALSDLTELTQQTVLTEPVPSPPVPVESTLTGLTTVVEPVPAEATATSLTTLPASASEIILTPTTEPLVQKKVGLRTRLVEWIAVIVELASHSREALRKFSFRAVLGWIRRNWISIWLIPQAAVSVALFFRGAGRLDVATSDIGVATIVSDGALRRERGDFAFRPSIPATPLFDWEGMASLAEETAAFSIDNSRYVLDPSTVVVFRAPFRDDRNVENRFRVLKGKVISQDHRTVMYARTKEQSKEIPKVLADRFSDAVRAKVYPRLGSRIFVAKAGRALIGFHWVAHRSGFVALLAIDSNRVEYMPVESSDHLRADIETDHPYAWQVISEDREVLEGPFQFQIASGGIEAWRRVLTDPALRKEKGGVDILLDEDRVH